MGHGIDGSQPYLVFRYHHNQQTGVWVNENNGGSCLTVREID